MSSLDLRVGSRSVHPLNLSQAAVYADVLEGVPNREINARIVENAVETAKRMHGRLTPRLITPTQRRCGSKPEQYTLPPVRCIVRFRSFDPAHDMTAERSEACLVWFQEKFAFPVASEVLEAMRKLDWTEFAKDDFM